MKQQMTSDFFTNYYEGYLNKQIAAKEAILIELAESLQKRMGRLIENVKTGQAPNALGEIQGLGSEIDRLTGELSVLRGIVKDLPSQIRYAEVLAHVFDKDEH